MAFPPLLDKTEPVAVYNFMECVEGYDNYHKEYSPSKHLKGVAWKLHTAVLFTYCKLECRHIITLAKKEAGGCGLYSCHSD